METAFEWAGYRQSRACGDGSGIIVIVVEPGAPAVATFPRMVADFQGCWICSGSCELVQE